MPTDPIAAAASVAPLNPSDPYLRRAQTSPALTDEQRERQFLIAKALPLRLLI
jgi:hypothetical protein